MLACADEVGRGALSGPVSVGVVAVTEQTRTAPQGVRDSKLLSPDARARLAPRIRRWATTHGPGYGVGHARTGRSSTSTPRPTSCCSTATTTT